MQLPWQEPSPYSAALEDKRSRRVNAPHACLLPIEIEGVSEELFCVQAFVMADTTYNSLGVDEVAAQHVNAQCVVGNVYLVCLYGYASVHPASLMRPCECLIGHW